MNWFTGIVVFLLIWWTALFAVLPWGIRHDENPQEGNITSAPDKPQILRKFIATTAVSVVIWVIMYVLIDRNVIDFYSLSRDMMQEDLTK